MDGTDTSNDGGRHLPASLALIVASMPNGPPSQPASLASLSVLNSRCGESVWGTSQAEAHVFLLLTICSVCRPGQRVPPQLPATLSSTGGCAQPPCYTFSPCTPA